MAKVASDRFPTMFTPLNGAAISVLLLCALILLFSIPAFGQMPSSLPPEGTEYPGGYIVKPYDPKNLTAEERAAMDNSGATETVSFLQLPLWIQMQALPLMLVGALTSLAASALVVRRIKKGGNNPNKHTIYSYIQGNPGCTAPELAREQKLNIGTVRYHIRQLESESRIVMARFGKFTRIFVNSHTYDDREKVIASHLRNDTSKRILRAILENPGITNQALADKLQIEKSLVYRYTQRLEEDVIIEFEWEGKNKKHFVRADAKEALVKLMPLNYQCPGMMREYKADEDE